MRKLDFYQDLTNRIIHDLERDLIPWEKPWFTNPVLNGATGKVYRGVNQITLAYALATLNIDNGDSRFLTFNQAKAKGWKVKKGAKSVAEVVFYKVIETEEESDEVKDEDKSKRLMPMLKFSPVFHASQIEGIPLLQANPGLSLDSNKLAEQIVVKSDAKIVENSLSAFYSQLDDEIQIPPLKSFKTTEGYYGTLLHELAHWTGHANRLNRDINNAFGSESYAKEELVAELASVFLCAETGIEYQAGNHTAYIKDWIKVLKSDPFEIHRASKKAIQAVGFLTELAGLKNDEENY